MVNMTREECEKALLAKLKEMWDIYKQYDPEGDYITATRVGGSFIIENNKTGKANDIDCIETDDFGYYSIKKFNNK